MRKLLLGLLSAVLALSPCLSSTVALAAGESFTYSLTANGSDSAAIEVGDTLEVTLTLQNNSGTDYTMYKAQDYVCFDTDYFTFESVTAVGNFSASAITFNASTENRVYVNYQSTEGAARESEITVLTLQLTAIQAGSTSITNDAMVIGSVESGASDTVSGADLTVTITSPDSGSGGSGGSSGGSSGGTSSYAVNVRSAENGTVTSSHSVAARGATVTLTVSPDAGYVLDSLTVSNASTGATVAVTKVSDTRYTFTMPSAAVSVSASFQPTSSAAAHDDCPSEQFADVDDTAWYHEYIDYVVESGLMNGTSATTFEPDVATTRGMIVTILHRLEDEPTASVAHGFDDVVSESYYADSIAWAAENGIVAGYGDGSFGPDDAITREQMAAILYRYAQYKGFGFTGTWMFLLDYDDTDMVSDWAYESMCWMVMNEIITGTSTTTLSPQESATRAQVAAILMRFIESISVD
ncbi:MAG: S-layer homology domain-containing protein [Oscillospiraceae bacterium]|nr:S-layer homology domain-containing protein [Oscillospiraceae bacterium]